MSLLNFDGDSQEEMDDFSVMPAGEYLAQIQKSEIKPTKDGKGKRLNLQFKILEGKYNGRVVFEGLNIKNKNKIAENISLKTLKTICVVCNKPHGVKDSEELHGKPMIITLKIKPAQNGYPEGNAISYYKKIEKAEPVSDDDSDTDNATEKSTEKAEENDAPIWDD